MVMMQGIQHFFSGFILLKVPFSLTSGFKNMFQRGLDLPDLESSYVSSVSWYFLVMYGLRSFFQLVAGETQLELREQERMLIQDFGMKNQSGPTDKMDGESLAKKLHQEAEGLEVLPAHVSEFDRVEQRLLGKRMPRKVASQTDDFLWQSTKSKKK